MAVPRQRDWNFPMDNSWFALEHGCNGCPSTEGLKQLKLRYQYTEHYELQWLSLDRGIETHPWRINTDGDSLLQWLSLDRGIETQLRSRILSTSGGGCNGCPSTEGLKRREVHFLSELIEKLQWLSLDRGIETPQLGDVDIRSWNQCCNGCPSTEGLKLFFAIWNFCVILVVMDVFRQRDWNLTY